MRSASNLCCRRDRVANGNKLAALHTRMAHWEALLTAASQHEYGDGSATEVEGWTWVPAGT